MARWRRGRCAPRRWRRRSTARRSARRRSAPPPRWRGGHRAGGRSAGERLVPAGSAAGPSRAGCCRGGDALMAKVPVIFTVNGAEQAEFVEPGALLVDVLRDKLRLTGTRTGCGQGTCGACTVLVDGEPVLSCLTLAARANGTAVTTVEGIATGGVLHPLQRAFADRLRRPVRLLHLGHDRRRQGAARPQPRPRPRRGDRRDLRQHLPLHRLRADHQRHPRRRRRHARREDRPEGDTRWNTSANSSPPSGRKTARRSAPASSAPTRSAMSPARPSSTPTGSSPACCISAWCGARMTMRASSPSTRRRRRRCRAWSGSSPTRTCRPTSTRSSA